MALLKGLEMEVIAFAEAHRLYAHRALDEAVFAAYGWSEAPGELRDEEILGRLLALNLTREPA